MNAPLLDAIPADLDFNVTDPNQTIGITAIYVLVYLLKQTVYVINQRKEL